MSKRPYDIIVWGATGFTGKLTCKYFHETYPNLSWAMAGRSPSKLEEVKKELNIGSNIAVLSADLNNPDSLDQVFQQAKVVLTTAGPYAKIGTEVLRSCVRVKSHYCDLTAELPWIRHMIDELDATATANKIRIVNSSGFDCIPSDLGCQMMAEEMIRRGLQPARVRMIADDMRGGASGGTMASAMSIFESPINDLRAMLNPFYLNKRTSDGKIDQSKKSDVISASSDNMVVGYDHVMKIWTMPYIMQTPNTRITNRSNSLLNFKYGLDFIYDERMKQNLLIAVLGSLIIPMIGALFMFPFTRDIIKRFLPQPGTGPSEKARDKGYFKMKFWGEGYSKDDHKKVIVYGGINAMNGDPGYKQTAVMIAEAALCLAQDDDKLPNRYGFLTPSVAMGSVLRERLEKHNIHFYVDQGTKEQK